MKRLWGFVLAACGVLVACQSPVSNPMMVTGTSTLPLGSAAGVSVYAADASGYGLLYYGSTATNWVAEDWSAFYTSQSPYSSSMVYPPVYDVAVSSGTIYAATKVGLFVGAGSSWTRVLTADAPIYGVAVSGSTVYASTAKGLFSSTTPTGSWTTLIASTPVFQWTLFGSYGVASTSLGLYASSSPTTASYTATSGLNSSSPNTASVSGSTLYVGTPVGLSVTTSPTLASFTNNTNVGAGVNGVLSTTLNGTPTLFLATTTGLEYTQSTGSLNVNASTTWSSLISGVGVHNIVGANTATYYYSNGAAGLGILQIDTSGNVTQSSVLTWANVAKVSVTNP